MGSLDCCVETHFHFELAVLAQWVLVHPDPHRVLEVCRDTRCWRKVGCRVQSDTRRPTPPFTLCMVRTRLSL